MKNRKGFTLIELMIVIAIIAIIAAIAIPGILSARRSANAGSALGNLKAFSTAMATYSQDQDDQSYPADSESFGDYYSHIPTKGGYAYIYAVDTGSPPSKYIYSAVPTSISNGTKAFFVDESNRLWYVDLKDTGYTSATALTPVWTKGGADRLGTPAAAESTWNKKS